MITMLPVVNSSQVLAHGYDAATGTLHVHFRGTPERKDRKTGQQVPARPPQHYSYANITAAQAHDFASSASKGAWVHAHLKPNPVSHPHTHHGDAPAHEVEHA